jgi:putative oxidoreductase
MSAIEGVMKAARPLTQGLDAISPLPDLVIRLYVAWEFFKSGLTKIQSWDTTLMLFEYEYEVPFLDPAIAAYLGTVAELVLPALVAIGLVTRLSAIGLFAFNVVAVYAYWSFLGSDDGTAGLNQHIYWGLLLLVPIFHGPNKLSLDCLLTRKYN